MDYALSRHGLIPERVEEVASVCLGRSRSFRTPFGLFRYQSMSLKRYSIGAVLISSGDDSYLIAIPEKALADRVWADKRFSGGTREDYAAYLELDLRVDPEHMAGLSLERLGEVASAYRSAKITGLLHYVISLQERRHA
jgi:hypothetical protein